MANKWIWDSVTRKLLPKDVVMKLRADRAAQTPKRGYDIVRNPERGVFVFDPETGDVVRRGDYRQLQVRDGVTIRPDIDPYINTHGEVIGSRAEHRAYLKRHGYEEVGNERAAMNPREVYDTGGVDRTIREIMERKA